MRLTIIEVFVIAVLLAALVAVGTSWYSRERGFDYLEIVQDDLRNLSAAQDAYAADNGGLYMPQNFRVTTRLPYYGYAPSSDVIVSITEPAPDGWSATATHALMTGAICGIYIGSALPAPPNPATEPGEPACD